MSVTPKERKKLAAKLWKDHQARERAGDLAGAIAKLQEAEGLFPGNAKVMAKRLRLEASVCEQELLRAASSPGFVRVSRVAGHKTLFWRRELPPSATANGATNSTPDRRGAAIADATLTFGRRKKW